MTRLQIRLFGEPQFVWDGQPWHFSAPPKALPALAYVLLNAGAAVSRATLATALWPDEREDVGRANLRRMLHRLTQALPTIEGGWVTATATTIAWRTDAPAWIDLVEFDRHVENGASAEAVELYRGDLLPSLYDDWIESHRERRRARVLELLLDLAHAARVKQDFSACARYASRMLEIDEWREDAVRELMTARYATGDRSSAIALYERFAHRLRSEMSADPMPETEALRAAIVAEIPLASAYEELDASVDRSPIREYLRLPFAGREGEIETLRQAWARAANGVGYTIFLCGDPGIGKSRTAAEIARIVQAQGGRAIAGTTTSGERVPYQAFTEALRSSLAVLGACDIDDVWLASLVPLVPELLTLRPHLQQPAVLAADNMRTRLQEAIINVIAAMSRMRPLLLVFEDVHWADHETIEMLGLLARRAGGMRLLVIATYRTNEIPDTLRELRKQLQRERRASLITLSPLNADAIGSLVEPIVDDADSSAVAAVVHRLSEGNPLFAWQLLHRYRETGILPSEADARMTVRDAVIARVEGLSADVRAVAEFAATIGREFALDLLCQAGGLSEDSALFALGTLMDRQLIRETGARALEYGFTHWLIAAAIYEQSDERQRRLRHLRIAQVLEKSGSNEAATLARHWEAAGDGARASAAYMTAARAALAVYARDEAIVAARKALDLAPDAAARFAALELLLESEANYSDVDAWARDLAQLEEAAASVDDEARYRVFAQRERFAAQTSDRTGQQIAIDRMIEIGERLARADLHSDALDALGMLHVGLGQFGDALEVLRRAMAAAKMTNDRKRLSRVRQHLIQVLARSGDAAAARSEFEVARNETGTSIEERLDLLRSESFIALISLDGPECLRIGKGMLEIATRVRDVVTEAKAYWLMGSGAQESNDFSAFEYYEEALKLFARIRQPHSLVATRINIGVFYLNYGQHERAATYLRQAAAEAEECRAFNLLGYALGNLSEAECAAGRFDAAYDLAKRTFEAGKETGEHRLQALAHESLGHALCSRGDYSPGIRELMNAVYMRREVRDLASLAYDLTLLVDALLSFGSNDEAHKRAIELTRLFESSECRQKPTKTIAVLAREAGVRGDTAAVDAWERRGRELAETTLKLLPDDEWRAAFRALAHNAYLLGTVSV